MTKPLSASEQLRIHLLYPKTRQAENSGIGLRSHMPVWRLPRTDAETVLDATSKQLDDAGDPELFLDVIRRWEPFDSEFLVAVMAVALAELSRVLVNKREALQRWGRFPTGRYALWSFYNLFKMDCADSMQVDLTNIMAFRVQRRLGSLRCRPRRIAPQFPVTARS